jgi:hypothetical protein
MQRGDSAALTGVAFGKGCGNAMGAPRQSQGMQFMNSNSVRIMLAVTALALGGCATGGFATTWKDPAATALQPLGANVVAVVVMKDGASRRAAEDALAAEITKHGAKGVALYTLMPDSQPSTEAAARAALEKAGIQGVVSMRPVDVDTRVTVTPTYYSNPSYRSYWGGYYGHGWGSPWNDPFIGGGFGGTQVISEKIVTVETLVYSLTQNKLVWSGTSSTTNPPKLQAFVKKLTTATVKELDKQGLLAK